MCLWRHSLRLEKFEEEIYFQKWFSSVKWSPCHQFLSYRYETCIFRICTPLARKCILTQKSTRDFTHTWMERRVWGFQNCLWLNHKCSSEQVMTDFVFYVMPIWVKFAHFSSDFCLLFKNYLSYSKNKAIP